MRGHHRQFSGAPLAVNGQGSVTVSVSFLPGIEATAMFAQPLSERCVFHELSQFNQWPCCSAFSKAESGARCLPASTSLWVIAQTARGFLPTMKVIWAKVL